MPRVARIVLPGLPHQIAQRGNNRQDTFFVNDDRVVYLTLPPEQADKFGVRIEGHCLKANHMHIVAMLASDTLLRKLEKSPQSPPAAAPLRTTEEAEGPKRRTKIGKRPLLSLLSDALQLNYGASS